MAASGPALAEIRMPFEWPVSGRGQTKLNDRDGVGSRMAAIRDLARLSGLSGIGPEPPEPHWSSFHWSSSPRFFVEATQTAVIHS